MLIAINAAGVVTNKPAIEMTEALKRWIKRNLDLYRIWKRHYF